MSGGRPHAGELTALAGALGLLVLLFLQWFSLDVPGVTLERSGWGGVGWLLATLLGVLIALGIAVAVSITLPLPPAWSIAADVAAVTVGAVATVALLVRLLTQPALGVGATDDVVDVAAVAWIGLLCTALVPTGAWAALSDERTGAPESEYTPPPARPVPQPPSS